ncbi:uncharacterized protein LOC129303885 [Prosopis cineraria]|uniref:uncharacterized protein LOC129303885 n=1 Tax=Prosopis cineraria TaxID=364024 RepID=UPI00240FF525|nr:uncharacterized protein LOC129303885 [Prosopis cineraria]XP_054799425.1 uncharacterized protein LOC129303885 [Prosopis cineraria]XP_054799426.1 uncharacterized protein LOC129303885 [Prosopis cineraria]XP_054799427.1 uncharacterized protein LOC129303885 [Prosopis cineraria]XP_054799428.1 uncharacterized protein LOC129303885 [Prosopis cineraria]
MGKSLQSAARLQELSRIVSSAKAPKPSNALPRLPNRVATPAALKSQASQLKMESSEGERTRIPLAHVVADCAKRWFQDTLKEAQAGDSNMQVLVGQMYNSGYGVPRDPRKGHAWISKASRTRNSVWKASEKHPGYRASDSDSNERENKDR